MHYLLKLLTLTTCLQSLTGSHAAAQPITTQPAQRLYQGQDPQLADSPLKNYQAGYNTTQNHIYLNTQATDLNQGGNIMASLHHEAQRKENHDNPCLRPLSEAQQTNLAHFRGDRAQKVWDRLTDSHPNPTTTHAWNRQHQASLAPSNARVAQARHQDVEPRVLEKLDPRYWQAKASGDEAKAQKLQAGWEKVEPWVPVLGSGVAAFEDFEKGQYVKATLQAGLAATEAIGLGALKKLVTTGAQVGIKQGAKGFAQGVKVLEKEAARGVNQAFKPLQRVSRSQVEAVAKVVGGKLSAAKNSKGYIIKLGHPKRPTVIRLMNEGSGKRGQAYFRISKSGKGARTRGGAWSDDPGLTHIDLHSGDLVKQVQEVLDKMPKKK